ncbi:MAG: transcriptional repressor LexA [Lachnospiraceae bacterium]|nr:transcriptional repressor LexA [Lachnospiraceae bacterium]
MKEQLTDKEKAMYDFICDTIRREGFSPSVRDIQNALGIKSTSTVHSYLNRLEEKGAIQKESGKSRTLRVDAKVGEPSRTTVKVPIVGRVTAGMPILATENFEGYFDFPLMNRSYAGNSLFALRVRGTSMIGVGIMDGDVIVVRKQSAAENGDIVVALVGEEATVKTFYKENGHFRLQPENPTMEPIIVDEVIILGQVISSFRFYF